MKHFQRIISLLTAITALSLGGVGCKEKTESEKAMDAINDAAKKTGDAVKDAAQKTEAAAKEAVKKAEDSVKK